MRHSHMRGFRRALSDAYLNFEPVAYATLIDALKNDSLTDEEIKSKLYYYNRFHVFVSECLVYFRRSAWYTECQLCSSLEYHSFIRLMQSQTHITTLRSCKRCLQDLRRDARRQDWCPTLSTTQLGRRRNMSLTKSLRVTAGRPNWNAILLPVPRCPWQAHL